MELEHVDMNPILGIRLVWDSLVDLYKFVMVYPKYKLQGEQKYQAFQWTIYDEILYYECLINFCYEYKSNTRGVSTLNCKRKV